ALFGDRVCNLHRTVDERLGLDDLVDEADGRGLVRADHLSGEDQLHRLALADEPGQPLRAAAAGDDAEVDLGLPELRLLRGDPDVTRERELAPAAEAEAVDRRDDR